MTQDVSPTAAQTKVPAWIAVLDEAAAWVEQAYPDEGCGLIVESDDLFRFLRCENLAGRRQECTPVQSVTARTSYIIDPLLFIEAEDRGESVVVIVHSHAGSGAYFSDSDLEAALMPPTDHDPPLPKFPGVDYLVFSVRDGVANHASLFRFDAHHPRGYSLAWETRTGPYR